MHEAFLAQIVKDLPAMQETWIPDPWVRKIPWRKEEQDTPVFFLENPTDRGAWRVIVHGVTKSRTRLRDNTHFHRLLNSLLCYC